MTAEHFTGLWESVFSKTIPIQYLFKKDYHERWLRIHSLPESKRYADTEGEWNVLLNRQNTLITDLLGSDTKTLLVTGDYNFNEPEQQHITETEPCFSGYRFKRLNDIELNKVDPDGYQIGDVYRPAFAETRWQPNVHDNLLKSIANDEVRAFFVVFDQPQLIAPYDGGIDIILRNAASRDAYKDKYKEWLSALESGL